MSIELTKKQLSILKKIELGYNLFITGGAGTGKSFLINQIKMNIPSNKNLFISSTTGISAININGKTFYSWAGLEPSTNINNISDFINIIQNNHYKLNYYLYTDILIIDEISMLDGNIIDFINNICKIIRNSNKPFGGIQVILFGDFYQLPPVKYSKFAFQAESWNEIIDFTINLKKIFRQSDIKFIKLLNKIRKGKITKKIINLIKNCNKIDKIKKYTHLYSNKFNVNVKNLIELDKINEKYIEIHANIICKDKNTYFEFPNCNIAEILKIKKGAFIMITKNIDIDNKLVNGTQAIFKKIENDFLIIETLDNKIHKIKKHTWDFLNFKIEQFPICLAWAITIHKSQGMGIKYLSIDIGDSIFEEGQCYVALSRALSLDGLHIKKFSIDSIKCNEIVKKYYLNLKKKSLYWYIIKKHDFIKLENISNMSDLNQFKKPNIELESKSNNNLNQFIQEASTNIKYECTSGKYDHNLNQLIQEGNNYNMKFEDTCDEHNLNQLIQEASTNIKLEYNNDNDNLNQPIIYKTNYIELKPNTKFIYQNIISGKIVLNIPNDNFIKDKNKFKFKSPNFNNNYLDFNKQCSTCSKYGCRKDFINWYNEIICTECIINNQDYKQLNKKTILIKYNNISNLNILNTLNNIYHKIERSRNKYKTKSKIYLTKHINNYLNKYILNNFSNKINNNLLEKLKDFRKQKSINLNIPYYRIISNNSIKEIAIKLPQNKSDLLKINGIGIKKIEQYGDYLIHLVKNH